MVEGGQMAPFETVVGSDRVFVDGVSEFRLEPQIRKIIRPESPDSRRQPSANPAQLEIRVLVRADRFHSALAGAGNVCADERSHHFVL